MIDFFDGVLGSFLTCSSWEEKWLNSSSSRFLIKTAGIAGYTVTSVKLSAIILLGIHGFFFDDFYGSPEQPCPVSLLNKVTAFIACQSPEGWGGLHTLMPHHHTFHPAFTLEWLWRSRFWSFQISLVKTNRVMAGVRYFIRNPPETYKLESLPTIEQSWFTLVPSTGCLNKFSRRSFTRDSGSITPKTLKGKS